MSESEWTSVSGEAARRVSRAAVVKLGAAGVAGAIGVALAEPAGASAATGQNFFAQNGQTQEWGSAFSNSNGGFGYVFGCTVSGHQVGVDGSCISGIGVQGTSTSGNGVLGNSNASGPGSGGAAVRASATGGGDGLFAAASGSGRAVHGEHADSGSGVHGVSGSGDGVLGEATSAGIGVHGLSPDVNGYGVKGENTGAGAGVYGTTNSSGRSGVLGVNFDSSGAGSGVRGEGINGVEGVGLFGVSGISGASSGVGVSGVANGAGATGVQARCAVAGTVALDVQGPAHFSNAGVATIAGTTLTPLNFIKISGVSLTPNSSIVATLQTHVGGVEVAAAVPHPNTTRPANSSITIYLSKAVTQTVTIGWFAIN